MKDCTDYSNGDGYAASQYDCINENPLFSFLQNDGGQPHTRSCGSDETKQLRILMPIYL